MCEKHKLYFKKKLTNWKAEIIKTNNDALYNGSVDDSSVSASEISSALSGIGAESDEHVRSLVG